MNQFVSSFRVGLALISSVGVSSTAMSTPIIKGDLGFALPETQFMEIQPAMLATTIAKEPSSIPALRQNLKHRDWRVRQKAATSLGQLGSSAQSAIPDLIITLRDSKFEVILASVIALGNMGEAAAPAVPALIRQLTEPVYGDAPLPEQVQLALAKIGKPAVPYLIRVLDSNFDSASYDAVFSLRQIGKPAVPLLIQALKSPHWRVRLRAASALLMGQNAREAVPSLLERLRDKQNGEQKPLVKGQIIATLGANQIEAATVIPALIQLLPDADAARALGDFGRAAESAVLPLASVLRDRSNESSSRIAAVETLLKIGQSSNLAMPALRDALTDPEYLVRSNAATAIVRFGTKVEFDSAVRTVAESLQSKDKTEQRNAIDTLGHIGVASIQQSVPALVQFIQHHPNLGDNMMHAIMALNGIAYGLKQHQQPISQLDIQTTVQGLEIAQKILQQQKQKLTQLAKQPLSDFERYDLSFAQQVLDAMLEQVRQAIGLLQ